MNPQKLRLSLVAMLLGIVPLGLAGQTIYKCANSYSQTPCPQAKALLLDDSRAAGQKKQADAATKSDANLAQSMERERILQEKNALAAQRAVPLARQASSAPLAVSSAAAPLTKITPKRVAKRDAKQAHFVALVPATGKATTVKKKGQKKGQKKSRTGQATFLHE